MFVVKYGIEGKPGERTAGPYTAEEAKWHRDDIAAYEFVLYAIIMPVSDDVVEQFERVFE